LNNIISAKRNSAILLATLLLAGGIIAFLNPSFMKEAHAQQEYYYEEMNGHDERPSYYGNDNYEPREYQSYQPDYKPQYSSYGKDTNYKSKKDSGDNISLNINKLKCINNNVNINGNNNGSINVGNSGSSAATGSGTDEGYLGVGSYGDNGEGYDNGYNKQKDQGFTCIINNNNTNTNIVSLGGDNATDGNIIDPCIECILENLSPEQEIVLAEELAANFTDIGGTIQGLCEFLADETTNPVNKYDTLTQALLRAEVPRDTIEDILDCLRALGFDIFDPPGLSSSPTQTRLGLSNLPTIAQGTEDSAELTATEKITNLKQQWLDLLP
jgi:hypothetical protein